MCDLCSKGGKPQIIGPEEEDEEDDGYAFNEVRRTFCNRSSLMGFLHFLSFSSFYVASIQYSYFSFSLSDGRSIPGHRAVEVTPGTHGGVHEIRLHSASGPKPSGQSTHYILCYI